MEFVESAHLKVFPLYRHSWKISCSEITCHIIPFCEKWDYNGPSQPAVSAFLVLFNLSCFS